MTIYLASGNNHKRIELQAILKGHKFITPQEAGVDFDPLEDGSSFLENALIKARELFALIHAPVLADDSGICVDALDGRPGIYSARYGSNNGQELDASSRNTLLLKELVNQNERKARFVCAMVLMLSPDRFFVAQETMEGEIIHGERGTKGFGYDPILYIPTLNKTVAELSEEEKNRSSHRGLAGRRIAKILEDFE